MKKGIIILATLIILVIVILLVLFTQRENIENRLQEENIISELENPSQEDDQYKVKLVAVRSEFLLVEECAHKFYQKYTAFNSSGEQADRVYNLLDNEYIQQFGVTKDNLRERFGNSKSIDVDVTKIYGMSIENNKSIYFVYGYLRDKETLQITNLAMQIRVDNSNKTFSVLPYEYMEKKNYLNITQESQIEKINLDIIENKTYNRCEDKYQNDEAYVTKLFETYINRALYNPELAYQNLNTEYSQKRFENLQNYKDFIEKNRELYLSYNMQNAKKPEDFSNMQDYLLYLDTFQEIKPKSYNVSRQNNITQYVVIDSKENQYIFQETAPMQYQVILDTYTIDLPEFTQKYNNATDEQKVLLNIQKVFEAINGQDYKYVYNKLDETFKNNNFATLAEFEQYAKTHFFSKNKVVAGKAEKQGNIYLYDITISDATGKDTSTNKKNFVMQLKEGTDFVMSFGI